MDANDASFSSERMKQQSKMDTIEKEISRLMLKNGGQLFIVEQFERNGYSKDDMKSGGYFSDDDIFNERLPNGDKPIFKIRFKPRQSCHVH